MIKHLTFLTLSLLLLSIGCKSKKKVDAPTRSIEDIKIALENHNIDYQWFTAKAKIKVTKPGEFIPSATAFLRVQRDSAIWMVFKKLNIEVARALIKPDSFCIVYRFDRVYEKASTSELFDAYQLDLNFREVQDYLIGNIPDIVTDNMEVRQNQKEIICQTEIDRFLTYLRLDPYTLQLDGFDIFNQKNESVVGRFEKFKEVDGQLLSMDREFIIDSEEIGKSKAKINLSDVKINQPATMRFSIPSHYEQIKYYR